MPLIDANDLTIHYEIAGKGHLLILLHGMGNNSQSWLSQIEKLQDHFTVIAWDAPGYGNSSDPDKEFTSFIQFADILDAFLDKLNYNSVYVLGHSMGAAIAIEYYSRYPDRVQALILADATRGSAALSEEENQRRLASRLNNIDTLTPQEIASRRVTELLSPHASEDVRKNAEAIMAQIRPKGYKSVAYSLFNANQMALLPNISVPTLVICGELDRVTPVSESMVFHEKIHGSKLEIIPLTGHLCYQEDPEKFYQIVVDFLKNLE